MTRREFGWSLAGALLFGSLTLWGVIAAIDHYAFGEDGKETVMHLR